MKIQTKFFFMYVIQHCSICRPSDSPVTEDAGIEPRTVATVALTARHSNLLARCITFIFHDETVVKQDY